MWTNRLWLCGSGFSWFLVNETGRKHIVKQGNTKVIDSHNINLTHISYWTELLGSTQCPFRTNQSFWPFPFPNGSICKLFVTFNWFLSIAFIHVCISCTSYKAHLFLFSQKDPLFSPAASLTTTFVELFICHF